MATFLGYPIVANPFCPETRPRIAPLAQGICSDHFTDDFNAWLLERFGLERVVVVIDGTTFAHPNTLAKIKRAFAKTGEYQP